MWGQLVDASALRGDLLSRRRTEIRLSKDETARRIYAHIVGQSPGSDDKVALVGTAFAWTTEKACRRAVDDLEHGKRVFKEGQHVDALLAVLGLEASDVGLVGQTGQ